MIFFLSKFLKKLDKIFESQYLAFLIAFWFSYPEWNGLREIRKVPIYIATIVLIVYGFLKNIETQDYTTKILAYTHIFHLYWYLFIWIPYFETTGLWVSYLRPNLLFVILDLLFYYFVGNTIIFIGNRIISFENFGNRNVIVIEIIRYLFKIIFPIYTGLYFTSQLHYWFPKVFFWHTGHLLSTTFWLALNTVDYFEQIKE
jgi:hypothetical protein